jgi:enamine deaminase RidA (YjgF/YER057c/UK114 family)
MASPETRIAELGLRLPAPTPPRSTFVRVKQVGRLLFVAGHGPPPSEAALRGKVGQQITVEQARVAARDAGLNALASLKAHLGTLDRVSQVVSLVGWVNCAPGMNRTADVLDGCSALLLDVFGRPNGEHARAAIGVAELPNDFPVEIEMVVEAPK